MNIFEIVFDQLTIYRNRSKSHISKCFGLLTFRSNDFSFKWFNFQVLIPVKWFFSKFSGRQLLRKFQVQKFYPKLRLFEPKLRVFENRRFVFLNENCSFCSEFFCDETSEYQIHTKFLTKYWLSENRRNSRSFRRKWNTV
jgi:hypothetical protein